MPLFNKRLSEKDKIGLQSHINWIQEHPEQPTNPIMDNFCHRTGIDMNKLVRIVKNGWWIEVQRQVIFGDRLDILS